MSERSRAYAHDALDARAPVGKGDSAMKLSLPLAAAASLLALAACQQKTDTVKTTTQETTANTAAPAAPVELPPSIETSATFRCKDQSLVYVDFFNGHKMVNLKTTKDGAPVQLKSDVEGGPYTAEGYSLKGDQKNITITQPGKAELTCHV